MQLQLIITDSPSLSVDELNSFLDRAHRQGKNPDLLLAEYIREALKKKPKQRRNTREAKAHE